MILERLTKMLKRHEGKENKVYLDTKGIPTIGYGRNLKDVGISDKEAELLLVNDIEKHTKDARVLFEHYDELDDLRQEVLVNMAFNMGRTRLGKFKNMIAAVDAGDFAKAAAEALDSRWSTQVKGRANELAYQLRTGEVGTPEEWAEETLDRIGG
jgi:lysozyme